MRFIGLRAAPIVLLVALMMLFLPSAQAVHKEGLFELDTAGTPATAAANVTDDGKTGVDGGDDWENVCYQVLTDSDCGSTTPSTADDAAWASDSFNGASSDPGTAPAADATSIYTGGGSKDTEEINQWAYKDTGGLPDKDNILHAFAAKYDDFLYFGMDRWANDGDAQLGFWFFKNPVTQTTTKSGGGFAFDGDHATGDLLILSDFSNGGTVSTIKVYEWTDATCTGLCASPHLQVIADSSNPASCAVVASNDTYCGVVNATNAPTDSEWAFKDKNGLTNQFSQGELFEGGINLSTIAPNTCFASFLVESRSSTSPTATLKDFVLAPEFGGCESSISSSQTWTPADSATVGVTGTNTWAGTVTFKLYKGGSACPTSGTPVYTSNAISVTNTGGSADPTASTSDSTGNLPPSITQTDAGSSTNYWWVAEFAPDATTAAKGVGSQSTCETTTIAIDDTP